MGPGEETKFTGKQGELVTGEAIGEEDGSTFEDAMLYPRSRWRALFFVGVTVGTL